MLIARKDPMNKKQREELVKGLNMLSRPANDPEFGKIRKIVAEAFGQFPRDVQYRFMNLPEATKGCPEIKFFAEQCALYCSREMKGELLKINYVILNMIVSVIYRELKLANEKGLTEPL